MGRCMVPHQGEPALLIQHTLHAVTALQGASRDPVEDHLPEFRDILHPDHILRGHQGAGIGRLTPSLGVEERLVEHRKPVEAVEHDRIKLDLARLFVVELLRRRQGLCTLAVGGKGIRCLRLFLRCRVALGDQRVEVVRDLHDSAFTGRDLLHHLGRDAVRVVEGDHLFEGDPRALRLIVPGDLLDDPRSPLKRCRVPAHLASHDLPDHADVLLEVIETYGLHLGLDQVGQILIHREIVHHPERSSQDETGEVALADV